MTACQFQPAIMASSAG